MKRTLRILAACMLLLPASMLSSAAGASASRVASDELLRAQLRLHDLGYYTGSVDGVSNSATLAALYAFCDESGIPQQTNPPAALYAESAIPAKASAYTPSRRVPIVFGNPVLWDDARQLLADGEIYSIISCYNGQTFRMRYTGGVGHAHMTPLADDDANALLRLFGELRDFSKQPVVIRLGDISAAASLQAFLHNDDAGDADTVYSLYFTGSISDVGGLMDDDHVATIHIAARH